MRLKVLLLFVAVQLVSFLAWQQVNGKAENISAPVSDTAHAAAEKASGIYFSARNNTKENRVNINTAVLKENLLQVLAKVPSGHAHAVSNIILDYNPAAHRGLGGKKLIILRAHMATDELIAVFLHELGHNVDLIGLAASKTDILSAFKDGETPIYATDPSVDFYSISWANESERKKGAGNFDFVSGYAMSDPFEDFGETYMYYVLHNQDFRALTGYNEALLAKYTFMRDQVFNGVEFDTDDGTINPNFRPWDVTVLPYDLNSFLN